MDGLITIRTADEPPAELIASRAVLIANSKVFADMFSLPQGGWDMAGKDFFDVAETQEVFKPFVRLLNLAHGEGDPLEELRNDDWPVMALLADKYDAAGVRGIALGKHWELRGKATPSAVANTFKIALSLNRQDLLNGAAFLVLEWGLWVRAQLELETQFEHWIALLKLHALQYAVNEPRLTHDCDVVGAGDETTLK